MTTKSIPGNVLDTLKASRCEGNLLFLPQQLDRKLYEATNHILALLGGKWDRFQRGHLFETDCAERVDAAVMSGQVVDFKQLYQFFPTPPALAARVVQLAGIKPIHAVLEPSAGTGALLAALPLPWPLAVSAVELNEPMAQDLWAKFPALTLHRRDFLELMHVDLGRFDRIIMNPPFRNGQDIAHVRHAYALLEPGGRLVAITSPAWQYRSNSNFIQFRDWLEDHDHDLEELPAGAFAQSGTEIRTLLLTLNKPLDEPVEKCPDRPAIVAGSDPAAVRCPPFRVSDRALSPSGPAPLVVPASAAV
jgi:protein-L-isoaspartate O-methyltransferase